MTDIRQRLVDVYVQGPIQDVHDSSSYKKLCRDHEGDRAFDGERLRVETLRRNVDEYLGKRGAYREQVEFGLRLLRKLQSVDERGICRELILRTYGGLWSIQQLEYFKSKSLFIVQAKHYFLSFTNRNPSKGNLNQVNRDHQHFIVDTLGIDKYEEEKRKEQNLVAEAVHHLLQNRSLEGFFYPEHKESNTVVETKLRENCVQAFAFVQLIQGEIFRYYPTGNWCHFEYEVSRNGATSDILFVQIDDEIPGDEIYLGFDPWYQEFATKDVVKLKATRWPDCEDIEENHQKISHKLAEQILRSVNRIYVEIPH